MIKKIGAAMETPYNAEDVPPEQIVSAIQKDCTMLKTFHTRGEIGAFLARIVLQFQPRDIRKMEQNFGLSIRDLSPGYRKELETAIAGHLLGTYQAIRLMDQSGAFARMNEPVTDGEKRYWAIVCEQCRVGPGDIRLRFLKFLLAGFCMIVRQEPGHPAGLRFPGGDFVECIDGVYYCPVKEKANDVDAALCPFCPAKQTPSVGYLKPPVNASEHRKQEFIENCYRHHNFNG
ncbi:DUF2115 domain-containing protein [Methanoregula sp.]|uniref:DUF2115 domain-containing protein n=1 Tax=Methanoregula sp. TaxID=2052170 RepID=UPI003BB1F202